MATKTLPKNLEGYQLFEKAKNTCTLTGVELWPSGGYATEEDSMVAGKVYAYDALLKSGLIQDIALTNLDEKIVKALLEANITRTKQIKALNGSLQSINGIGEKSAEAINKYFNFIE